MKIMAQASSSKECPYLRTKPETINPIDHPMAIRLKKRKSNKSPIQINEN